MRFRDMPYSVQLVWVLIGICSISVSVLMVGFTVGPAIFAIFM